MATTAAQQALLTVYSNDLESDISTTLMDTFYAANDSDFDKTVCDCIEYKIAKLAGVVDTSAPQIGTRNSASQRRAHLVEDLKRWQQKAGIYGAELTAGIIDMQLDYEDDAS